MLYIRVWGPQRCLSQRVLACVVAQGSGHTPEVGSGFGWMSREGHTSTIFFKKCLKTEIKILNGKEVKWTFTECLYLLGITVHPGLAKSLERARLYPFWHLQATVPCNNTAFCCSSTSNHSYCLNELVWLSSYKALQTKTGGRPDFSRYVGCRWPILT